MRNVSDESFREIGNTFPVPFLFFTIPCTLSDNVGKAW
jgi:hypothetical protein